MIELTLSLDDDDARDVNRAIAYFQGSRRWPAAEGGGTLLPEGDSDQAGAILGEICRDWLEAHDLRRSC